MIERLKITHLYTSPTAIRLLIKAGDHWVKQYDRSTLRVLGCGKQLIQIKTIVAIIEYVFYELKVQCKLHTCNEIKSIDHNHHTNLNHLHQRIIYCNLKLIYIIKVYQVFTMKAMFLNLYNSGLKLISNLINFICITVVVR